MQSEKNVGGEKIVRKKKIYDDFWCQTNGIVQEMIGPGGARGVMVMVTGNEHGDTSSDPGRDWLHFTLHLYP